MTVADELSFAVERYIGYGTENCPSENSARLIDAVGVDRASVIEPTIKQLLEELNQLKPDWSNQSLVSAGQWAKEQMHMRHPELSASALNALEWIFTWWWR